MNKLVQILCLLHLLVFSQDREGYQLMITHDNDSFAYFLGLRNDDDHYTGGVKVELFTPEWDFWMPFPVLKQANKNRNTVALSLTAFTPQDLGPEIQYGDRPYASFSALSMGKESYTETSFLKTELYMGALGLDFAKKGQSYMHRKRVFGTKRVVPEGWHHQIENGGVFTFNYAANYLKQLASKKITCLNTNVVAAYRLDANLGSYMTDFALGLNLALNMNTTPFIAGVLPAFAGKEKKRNHVKVNNKKFRMNLYVEPKVKYVLHNSTLQGALFEDNSVYTIDSSDIKRFQFECSLGVNLVAYDAFYLGFDISGRGQEFKGAKDVHFWGGLNFGVRCD